MVDDARGADQEVQGKDPILTPRDGKHLAIARQAQGDVEQR
jgi:hypothetical protein